MVPNLLSSLKKLPSDTNFTLRNASRLWFLCSELKPLLAVAPSMASRPEMRGVARVGELIGALERRGVDTAAALKLAWASDPSFLHREVAMWVNHGKLGKLAKMWPGLVKSEALE